MNHRLFGCAVLVSFSLAFAVTPVRGQEVHGVIERGLKFVEQDAAKWRTERECATCHHGTMTVWAQSEAVRRGYAVSAETVADTIAWTKERLAKIDEPRDTRPGWSMVNSPALYLAAMARTVPDQTAISADELKQIAGHLLRHQESDGSWAWSSAPAKNRPPPFFESDEVATRWACLALLPQSPSDPIDTPAVRESRNKAIEWLKKTPPSDTTQAALLRLVQNVRSGEPAEATSAEFAQIFSRQNEDGGWGQLDDSASDAYATGQALYLLCVAGADPARTEMQRAVAFLIANQKEDGSWPMVRRFHPGVTPTDFTMPIVYFGSAWATLGLLRSEKPRQL